MPWMQCKAPQKSNLNVIVSQNCLIIQISRKLWSQASSFYMRECKTPSSFVLAWKLGTLRQDAAARIGSEPFFLIFQDAQQASLAVIFFQREQSTAIKPIPNAAWIKFQKALMFSVCVCAQFNLLWLQNCICTTIFNFFLISKAVIYDSECVIGQHHLQQLHK